MSTFKGTPVADLAVGIWYALVTNEHEDESINLGHAPLAEYVGDGSFIDDEGCEFFAADFDEFVRQS